MEELLSLIGIAYIIIFIAVIMLIWNFIRTAVASGVEEGTKRAIDRVIQENFANTELRVDENDKVFLAWKKPPHYVSSEKYPKL